MDALVDGERVRVFSRSLRDVTAAVPEVVAVARAALGCGASFLALSTLEEAIALRERGVRARLLLLQTNLSVIDVALACGFVSPSHFSKCYRDFFGKTPRKERSLPPRLEAPPLSAA